MVTIPPHFFGGVGLICQNPLGVAAIIWCIRNIIATNTWLIGMKSNIAATPKGVAT